MLQESCSVPRLALQSHGRRRTFWALALVAAWIYQQRRAQNKAAINSSSLFSIVLVSCLSILVFYLLFVYNRASSSTSSERWWPHGMGSHGYRFWWWTHFAAMTRRVAFFEKLLVCFFLCSFCPKPQRMGQRRFFLRDFNSLFFRLSFDCHFFVINIFYYWWIARIFVFWRRSI